MLRSLPIVIISAAVVFVALVFAFPRMSRDLTSEGGIPCDVPVEDRTICVPLEDDNDADSPTALDPSQRPFTRVLKATSDIVTWSALGAFAVVSSIVLGLASTIWRERLRRFPPPSDNRLGGKQRSNVIVAVVFAAAGLVAAVLAAMSRSFMQATVLAALWVSAGPTIVSVLDCWTIARGTPWRSDDRLSTRVARLGELGRLHDRFIALLGAQVTIYVVWLSAFVRVRGTTEVATLASQGGEFLSPPHNFGEVVVWGALLTGLLALGYVPAASAIRRHADELVDEAVGPPEDAEDYVKANTQRAALASILGTDQPVQARFQSAVIVAAPLATSLLSSLLG